MNITQTTPTIWLTSVFYFVNTKSYAISNLILTHHDVDSGCIYNQSHLSHQWFQSFCARIINKTINPIEWDTNGALNSKWVRWQLRQITHLRCIKIRYRTWKVNHIWERYRNIYMPIDLCKLSVLLWFVHFGTGRSHIDGLVQNGRISIVNERKLLQSCTKPSIYRSRFLHWHSYGWQGTTKPLRKQNITIKNETCREVSNIRRIFVGN